ncbi:MAG: copper resistance protein NlpE N-terminal domain-containing protein [Sutterella wadsworthensis]
MKLAHTALIAAAAGVLTVTLAGCSAPTNGERSPAFAAAESLQSSEASAAPIGVYEGLLPCGDCAGLRTTIYVRTDGPYTRLYTYEGEKDDLGRTPSFLRPAAGNSRADDSPSRPKTIPRLGLLIRPSMV